jgi:hypothetical protein
MRVPAGRSLPGHHGPWLPFTFARTNVAIAPAVEKTPGSTASCTLYAAGVVHGARLTDGKEPTQ